MISCLHWGVEIIYKIFFFLVEGVVQDERLVGGGGGGGTEERRGGGRGRSRHHPPGRPAVPRARGPHPDSRYLFVQAFISIGCCHPNSKT